MKKKEALNYIILHKGYIPYIGIFEIYKDEDEIPQELIGNFMICGEELAKKLKMF